MYEEKERYYTLIDKGCRNKAARQEDTVAHGQKVIYYHDEHNDEFSTGGITARTIDGSYRYIRDGFWGRIAHVFWYRIIAVPLARCYMKIHFHHKIVGREKLKLARSGYYMYGNHTQQIGDAVIPTLVNLPKETSVIVHPDNVSMPVLGRITPYLGALPLPDDMEAAKHFIRAVEQRIAGNQCIMIYPEAHIWPFYTGIRPFGDNSFRYPVQHKAAVYCLTNTYQRRGRSKVPQIVTYIDGPFVPDTNRSAKEQKQMLREQVYTAMCERAKANNMEVIRYIKADDND